MLLRYLTFAALTLMPLASFGADVPSELPVAQINDDTFNAVEAAVRKATDNQDQTVLYLIAQLPNGDTVIVDRDNITWQHVHEPRDYSLEGGPIFALTQMLHEQIDGTVLACGSKGGRRCCRVKAAEPPAIR